jgi:hypothetical protein
LDWGRDLPELQERYDLGLPTPALEKRPELTSDIQEYIYAFNILSSRRSVGFGPNPIMLTEIFSYYDKFQVPYPLELFVRLIIEMDTAYLEWASKSKGKNGK